MLTRKKKIAAKLAEEAVQQNETRFIRSFLQQIGVRIDGQEVDTLPFSVRDTTAGTENEIQAAVIGDRDEVDLALTIERSHFYAHLHAKAAQGRSAQKLYHELDAYLKNNPDGVWESSWVRVPRAALNAHAVAILRHDLRTRKGEALGLRRDHNDFFVTEQGRDYVRVPVSYLLKLALGQVIGTGRLTRPARVTATRLMSHFINDNTSPEQHSAYVVPLVAELGMGQAVAKETAQRFLLTQLLLAYSNTAMRLKDNGQEAVAYFSALPPQRQRRASQLLSESFYRKLFMNPCLSGWDDGESKHQYMHLCHEVLSRSRLNATNKLRSAGMCAGAGGVISQNDPSLANNGTHLSIGSLRLTRALREDHVQSLHLGEKYVGDLAIKMVEHFLPLFVGTYSAAPRRLGRAEFRAEEILGFLPHQLDESHLAMLWRAWRGKAGATLGRRTVIPFATSAATAGRKGDYVPDWRLLDYLVALPSTARHPALDGRPGNAERLKADLAEQGVFDARMPLYLPYRLREFGVMGYSGYEGRYYSVFESFARDLGRAVELQTLVTALAYRYMAAGRFNHRAIPDDPHSESERRQIFFAAAIGLPACYVRKETHNLFLKRLLQFAHNLRPSARHAGCIKVPLDEYRKAALRMLVQDGADLIEALDLRDLIADMERRFLHPAETASARLTQGILAKLNVDSPMKAASHEFNTAGEAYFREDLRAQHLREALALLRNDCAYADTAHPEWRSAVQELAGDQALETFISKREEDMIHGRADEKTIAALIHLVLLSIAYDTQRAAQAIGSIEQHERIDSPVYRAGNG